MAHLPAGQEPTKVIYDEKDVPPYTLPEALVAGGGKRVTTAEEWITVRRPEVLELFSSQVYGRVPRADVKTEFLPGRTDRSALGGAAVRKEITIRFTRGALSHAISLLLYLPAGAKKPVPVFLGLNFAGNHTISSDPGISVTKSWVPTDVESGVMDHAATPLSRGVASSSWPVARILERGYGLATIYYGDIDPDFDDGFKNGIHPLFYAAAQIKPAPDQWGSIAAWAWGLSRAMDYLETDPDVDASRAAVLGHSRLGKTALWAGATDPRFALVISNNSGCGGAALSKRIFGETVGIINDQFPHWFCGNFKKYSNNEPALPVDQHLLIALIAPRSVYVASAEQDGWADPKGEYLSAFHAGSVYKLFGKTVLTSESMPTVNRPVIRQDVGYHVRSGEHALSRYDWERYLDFADYHFRGLKAP
ncbi:MAG: acetylxylan esterase [Candidatus Aminicenantes bacterium RBG_16_63_16]|nr:MAG: acetylxylan esterase [Candidatus Aminicenantes bacterium RBG_16_63_16]